MSAARPSKIVPRFPGEVVQKKSAKKHKYTSAEMAYFERIKMMPCSVCGSPPPTDAHHILEDRIQNQKSGVYTCIPLCKDCHQGSINGIHGQRRMWTALKKSEMDCLNETLAVIINPDWRKI